MTGAVVAIVPWGNVIEDYLDGIDHSLDDFVDTMTGGWLFGYVAALASAGLQPLLICVCAGVARPVRREHAATGVPVWLLPAPRIYRWLRPRLDHPYAWNWAEAVA